jgi:APA family basic amino acid/polyamine antiporter
MNSAAMRGPTATRREVGPLQLLALGVNGIVGVGIFFVPATVAGRAPGLGTVLVFLLTGLALLPAAVTFAHLGRCFDEDGGPVVFARAAFGPRTSFLVGWVAYVAAFFSTAAVIVGLVNATAPVVGIRTQLGRHLGAVVLTLLLSLVVASGLRLSARVWTTLTVLKLLPLVLLLAAFALSVRSIPAPATAVPSPGWLAAGLAVMFSFQGFEVVPVIAGQVRSSARAVPLATVGALVLAIALYCGLALACVSALPALASSSAPLADAASVLGGQTLGRIVIAGTSVSALGIAFGMIVTTPRYLSSLAAGEERLFGLDRVSPRGVPQRALAATTVLVVTIVGLGDLGELFALSSIAVLMVFGVSAASLLVLARRRERGLQPGHAWPVLPTLTVATALVVFGATLREAAVSLVTVLAGLTLLRLARRPASATPA